MRFRFAGFELDSDAYKLTRGTHELHLQPLVFDVLHYLIRNRERIVTKDELLEALWTDGSGNEAAVTWSISHVRRALSQTRWQKSPIETVHGRGYRFAADVTALDEPPVAQEPPARAEAEHDGLPFVGRGELMEQLQAQLLATEQGSGKLTVLVGEPGIGKTRCANALAERARQRGFTVLSAHSVEGVGEPVFRPWQQILRNLMQAQQDLRAPASALLTQLSAAGPELHAVGASDASTWHSAAAYNAVTVNRVRLFDGVVQLLLQAARLIPLFLLFDDLHWADAGTIQLLSFAAPELLLGRCMILGTQRARGTPHNERALAQLALRGQHVPLSYLTESDIARYIAELNSQREVAPELSAAVLQATAGNPLFVQETIRSLALTQGALHKLKPGDVQPPALARDVLRGPLRALPPEVLSLLATASVLGESFELTLLKHVAELDTEPLLDRLDIASCGGFVLAEAPNRYRFHHALIRTILYDDMPAEQRVAAHRRAAELLVRSADADQRASEIATHYYKSRDAGDPGAVVRAAIHAANAAERVHASEDSATFYQWALELQPLDPRAGTRDRAELLVRCGRAQRLAGREEDARRSLEAAIHLSLQHAYGDLLVRAAGILRPTHAMSMFPDELVRRALEQALELAPAGPHPQKISALSQLAFLPPISLDMEESKRVSALALSLARERVAHLESAALRAELSNLVRPQVDGRSSLRDALRSRMFSLSGPDDIDELLGVCDEILTLDQPRSDVSWRAQAARFGAYLLRGDLGAASSALEAARHLGEDLQMPEAGWHYERQQAQELFCSGRFVEARAACKRLRARAARIGLGYGPELTTLLRGAIDWEQFGAAAMRQYVDVWDTNNPKAQNAASVRSYAARMAAEAGALVSARRSWERLAERDFSDVPKEHSYLLTLGNCAITAYLLRDVPRAERLLALLSPYPDFNTPDLIQLAHGSVARYLGLLAATVGGQDETEGYFELALRENERLGHKPQLARTYYDYAQWVSTRSTPGARTRSRELAARAADVAQQLGMQWLTDAARPLA
ncbi:MAG TPA: AAA family ATPase [Polyangiales bacterium]|nr:AAA family ATPase [Polyangiales bacterium]